MAINHVSNGDEVGRLRETVRSVPVPEHVQTAAVRLVMATQPGSEYATAMVNDFVMMGSSPRGAQSLLLGGKVKALLGGRFAVSTEDVHAVAVAALRHRVMINFHGQSEGITTDAVLHEILANAKSSSVAQA